MLDKMGVNVGGILAIGGIGGIALGFAGKDLFANFFGFLVILSERPFKVGDLISSVDGKVKGVVQKVNWRITKILTLEKIPLYIPNSFFTTAVLRNETQMLARRVSEHLKFFCAECSATKVTNFSDSVNTKRFPFCYTVLKNEADDYNHKKTDNPLESYTLGKTEYNNKNYGKAAIYFLKSYKSDPSALKCQKQQILSLQ